MKLAAFSITISIALFPAALALAQTTDNWLSEYQPLWARDAQPSADHPSVAMGPKARSTAADTSVIVMNQSPAPPTETLPPATSYSEPWPANSGPSEPYVGGGPMLSGGVPCDCQPRGICYADAQILALRAHFGETAVGKLSEKYEVSQRVIVGIENPWGIGARVRYWSYDHATSVSGGTSDSIRFNFDVTDLEATTRFASERYDFVLAAGMRWADIKIDIDSGRSRNDMPGGTVAADLRALLCRDCDYDIEWHSITGARMSLFGGDWEGAAGGLITPSRDDNITVFEIYGGVEVSRNVYGGTVYTRLLFEAQNWRSDALGRDTDVDSLGFIGPSLSLGLVY